MASGSLPQAATNVSGRPSAVHREALAAALEEERSAGINPRDCRRHIARFICGTARRLKRLGKLRPDRFALSLKRADIAKGLELSLVRVKRTLALMDLSGDIEAVDGRIRVRDWRRLCAMAGAAPEELGVAGAPDEEEAASPTPATPRTTAAGEPAFFG